MLADGARTITVADEARDADSLLAHYGGLIALRNRTPALQEGEYEEVAAASPGLLTFWRRHAAGDRLVVLHFDGAAAASIDVPVPPEWVTVVDEISGQPVGEVRDGVWSATVGPRTGLVLGAGAP
jgi:glycosidase